MNVSFDFDRTLDQPRVQHYAKSLIKRGYNVMIHTQRTPEGFEPVFDVAHKVGIELKNIIFCGAVPKETMLELNEPVFHLDDDPTIDYDKLVVYNEDFEMNCEKML